MDKKNCNLMMGRTLFEIHLAICCIFSDGLDPGAVQAVGPNLFATSLRIRFTHRKVDILPGCIALRAVKYRHI